MTAWEGCRCACSSSAEFRQRAVELARVRTGSIREVAESLGISESCLRNWMSRADIDTGSKPGLTSDEHKELVELRREIRRLETENEILNVPPRASPGRTSSQNDLPGGAGTGRGQCSL
ncbi:transposase [Pseudonocardia sp. Cha107L01]|uniref:transposase n=1 Tax=Pseudonocardia sp. Cha107L01 TaxID=3457576 RepID=UPI00403E39FD